MSIYIGWGLIGALIPFGLAVLFFIYFHLWHFPFVVQKKPRETTYNENIKRWENWMIFYDSAESTSVHVSRYPMVNRIFSYINLGFTFALGETFPLMVAMGCVGLIGENIYRFFF